LRITILGKTRCVLLHFDSSKRCVCPLYKFLYVFQSCKVLFETPCIYPRHAQKALSLLSTIFFQRKQSIYPVLQAALFNTQSINVPAVFVSSEIVLQVFSLDTFTVKFLNIIIWLLSLVSICYPFRPKYLPQHYSETLSACVLPSK
jgi:hypothetical protein